MEQRPLNTLTRRLDGSGGWHHQGTALGARVKSPGAEPLEYLTHRFVQYMDSIAGPGRQYRPQRRFLRDIAFGILHSRSITLAEIGRSLNQQATDWEQSVENRLSRNLGSARLDDEALVEDYLDTMCPFLHDAAYPTPTIALDTSDIQKRYSKHMPHLAIVRDGDAAARQWDEKGKSKAVVGPGYSLACVEAVGRQGRRIPLALELFSHTHPDYRSQQHIVRDLMTRLRPRIPDRAIWVFDRGFDSRADLKTFEDHRIRFVVRVRSNRNIHHSGGHGRAGHVASSLENRARFQIRKIGAKRRRKWSVDVAWIPDVHLERRTPSGFAGGPDKSARYSFVVVRRRNKEPMLLITNDRVDTEQQAARAVNAYFDRWGVEDAFRFIKHTFRLEPHFRVLTWKRMRRLVRIMMMAYGFLSYLVHLDRDAIEENWKKLLSFGRQAPEYLFYALMNGMPRMLKHPGELPRVA